MRNFPSIFRKKKKLVPKEKLQKRVQKKKSVFSLPFLTGALMLIVFAWWGYKMIMEKVLGRFDMFNLRKGVVEIYGAPQVILLDPRRTDEYLDSFEGEEPEEWPYIPRDDPWPLADTLWYADMMREPEEQEEMPWEEPDIIKEKEPRPIDYWIDILLSMKVNYRLIEEPELVGLIDTYNILVIPGALLLSDEEKDSIKDFLKRGGRVLLCWSVGCRDENGEWTGFDFLSRLTGSLPSGSVQDISGGTSVVLRGNSPITAMIAPGTHLDFYTYNGYITMNAVEPRTKPDGYWFQPYWHDDSQYGDGEDCLITHGTYLEGKFAWISFVPLTIQDKNNNNVILSQLISNTLAWLQDQPVVNVSVWPEGYTAGGGIMLETHGLISELEDIIRLSNQGGLSPDLLVSGEDMPTGVSLTNLQYSDLIMTISESRYFSKLSFREQKRWFRFQSNKLKIALGKNPTGFHPDNWYYNDIMLEAAARSGIKYFLAEPEPDFYGPGNKVVKSGGWWIFSSRATIPTQPKSQISMKEWYEEKGRRSVSSIRRAMMRDLRRIKRAGGLYLGMVDLEVLRPEHALKISLDLTQAMDSMHVMRAPTSKLLERFTGWQNLRISSKHVTSSRVLINISNEGKIPLKNVAFQVYLKSDIEDVKITSRVVGFTPYDVKWNKRKGVCDFIIPEIAARENASIFIDLERLTDI